MWTAFAISSGRYPARSRSGRDALRRYPPPGGFVALAGRRGGRTLDQRGAAQQLAHGVLPGLEGVSGRTEVKAPDPRALGPGQRLRLVEVLVEALGPVAQRLGVVGVEVLHVQDLEPGTLERLCHPPGIQDLAVRKHVPVREVPAEVHAAGLERDVRDAMVQHAAAGLEHLRDALRVGVDLPDAD